MNSGDIAICGLIAILLLGGSAFSTRSVYEYFELPYRPSRIDRVMVWTTVAVFSLLLLKVLSQR
jgi:hypothetical protein